MIGNSIAGFLGAGVAASTTAYESIATTTVGAGGSSSISFSSIPSTYTHLQVRILGHGTRAIIGVGNEVYFQFNSDTGSNYAQHYIRANGSTAVSGANTSQTTGFFGVVASNDQASSNFGVGILDILNYTNTNKTKTTRSITGWDNNGTGEVWFNSSLWNSTAAINRIDFTVPTFSFVQYTTFALYGVK